MINIFICPPFILYWVTIRNCLLVINICGDYKKLTGYLSAFFVMDLFSLPHCLEFPNIMHYNIHTVCNKPPRQPYGNTPMRSFYISYTGE